MKLDGKKFTRKEILAVLAGFFVFLILFFGVLNLYQYEGRKRSVSIVDNSDVGLDYVEATAKLVSADLNKGELNIRLDFVPRGAMTSPEGLLLSRDLTLLANSATGAREFTFEKGKIMNPIEIPVSADGNINNYPFDTHKASLDITIVDSDKQGVVPLIVNFESSLNNFYVDAKQNPEKTTTQRVTTQIDIQRSAIITIFSVFLMILMWFLALTTLFVVLSVLLRGRAVVIDKFAYMATLLFALPAIREVQPGVPPIGALVDFLAFFWTEALVALSLIITIAVWLTRPSKS